MSENVRIGSTNQKMLTKKELIELIESNFSDGYYSNVAILTTVYSDVNEERICTQSITLGKILT